MAMLTCAQSAHHVAGVRRMKISSNKATHTCGVPVVRSRSSAHNARRLSPAVVARASSETAASTSSGTSAAEDNSDPTGTWRDKVRDGAVAFAATAAVASAASSVDGPAAAAAAAFLLG